MSRLIDADALKDKFRGTNANGINLELDRYVIKCIDDAPTIVPERKKGRWIHDGYDFFPHGIDWIHCSKCGKRWVNVPADLPKYCPCCGAHMIGAEDDPEERTEA